MMALAITLPLLGTTAQGGTLERMRATAAANAERSVTQPYEIDNIKNRRVHYGKPGELSYAVFMTKAGKPVLYVAVDGKCTSSHKRLESGVRGILLEDGPSGKHIKYKEVLVQEPSEDGTYGNSSPYIYCFTTSGTYLQWNGRYVVSNKPIELSIKPVVLTGDLEEGKK